MTGDLQVRNDAAQSRYELTQGGEVLGYAEYEAQGDTLDFTHTQVSEEHQGEGLGERLVRGALDDVRAQGQKVIASCPFVGSFIRKHAEYGDLLA
ncbi:GNAT family N-acetyltransferase [Deinococcus gobiensis]|uniref:Acetyltransferase-like protein n=2 Tax=Deinococcus TaxID=1298 RepID=H8GY55_DEIGI|nr:GNAT family N-acetyltransferase [Deinococcus gobiensis]AFD25983.1 Acetyltransferase-like protein [Deinococcus gobiensis I-0]